MSDNIRNFNDYRKKVNNDEQPTEEINIEIQDPLDFLSADEREEYYRTQHEAMDKERERLEEDSPEYYFDEDPQEFYLDEDEPEFVKPKKARNREEFYEDEPKSVRKRTTAEPDTDRRRTEDSPRVERKKKEDSPRAERKRKEDSSRAERKRKEDSPRAERKKKEDSSRAERKTKEDRPKAIRRKTRIEDFEDFDEGEERKVNGVDPYLIVRISSIISGIIILILIGMIFKAKVYDRYLVPDPDEDTSKVEVGELAGYTRTDDKIITTADLNLRNTPSTASDDFIVVMVNKGTVLDRVAVSDDGEWAQVRYEDQLLFCVMKYAAVQE